MMTRPTFFVPGAPKCGTTTLDAHLRAHPDICMSEPKEPDLFGSHFGDFEYVEACYGHCRGQRTLGDATVSYMVHSEVAQRIHEAIPHARFIIALREPIARAISHYEFRVQKGWEVRPFREVVAAGLAADALKFSAYYTHFRSFFDRFPMERFLFVQSTDLALRPEATMAKAFDFLGVGVVPIDGEMRQNVTSRPGNERTRKVLSVARRVGANRLVPASRKPLMRRLLARVTSVGSSDLRGQTDPRDYARLVELFEPEVDALEAATGLSLETWRRHWSSMGRGPAVG